MTGWRFFRRITAASIVYLAAKMAAWRFLRRAKPAKMTRLLDLPDEILESIVAGLAASDKIRFMAACKKALLMAMDGAEVKLKITKDTKFAGIKKVLDVSPAQIQLEIIRPSPSPLGRTKAIFLPLPAAAVLTDMLPRHLTLRVSGCTLESITRITIQATSLGRLVPEFVAAACPNLVQLKLTQPDTERRLFAETLHASLPLAPCTNLKQLKVDEDDRFGWGTVRLPPKFHSPAELHESLPNIDTLVFETRHCTALVQAFAAGLTRLHIGAWFDNSNMVQEIIRLCSRLYHLSARNLVLPDNPTALKVLELHEYYCNENDIEMLRQLPSLIELHVSGLINVQDWGNRVLPCQEVHINNHELEFTQLGYLDLSNVKRLGARLNTSILLPDPSYPDSRAAVQRAVDNLSHLGNIVFRTDNAAAQAWLGNCPTLCWSIDEDDAWDTDVGNGYDQEAAELLCIAAQRIGPAQACDIKGFIRRPLLLGAVLRWGATFLETVHVGCRNHLKPNVWQALQQLDRLANVVVYLDVPDSFKEVDEEWEWEHAVEGLDQEPCNLLKFTCSAARDYVIPASRSLCIQFGVSGADTCSQRSNVTDLHHLREPSRQHLMDVLAWSLPAGSKLKSVDFTLLTDEQQYPIYDPYHVDAFWTIVVEPL